MKKITTDAKDIRQGKIPHEIFTVNLVIINIFLSVAILKFGDKNLAFITSMGLSLIIILWSYFKNKQVQKTDNCFVKANWQMSMNRYVLLIIGYVLYWILSTIGIFIGGDGTNSMDGVDIITTIFNILSVVPLFFIILFLTIVGSGSLFNVSRGEVSQKIIDKYC